MFRSAVFFLLLTLPLVAQTPAPASPGISVRTSKQVFVYRGELGKWWQNADIVRRIQTDHSAQFKLAFLETNWVSLNAYYGGNYLNGVVSIKSGVMPRKSWVIDMFDGTYKIRVVIPDGQIVDRGDIVYKNRDAISFPVTLECYPDATGVKAYIYHATASVSL